MKPATPHFYKHRQRLKERFVKAGLDAFLDYEVLELLLIYAIPRKDVKPLAKNLLHRFGSLKNLLDASPTEIESVRGVSSHTSTLLKLIKEMGTIYLREKAREKPQIGSTRELLQYCMSAMGGLKNERFSVVFLNTQNRIIKDEIIQEGTVNQAVIYPRKVLEHALLLKASALILVHNHPSGVVNPSNADIQLTKAIHDTARTLDIAVHDHIIIGDNCYYSFREEGLIP